MRRLLLATVALLGSLAPAQMTDLPPLSEPRMVTTAFEDGLWHRRNGQPRDNTGDGTIFVATEGDARVGVLVMRMGTPPPGGAFWRTDYDSFPYENWTGNQQQPPIKGMPGLRPYSHHNIDTHHGFQHPTTLDIEWFSGIKPGRLKEWAQLQGNPDWQNAAGVVFCIQRSTQTKLEAEPANFVRYPNEVWLEPHPLAKWEHPVYYKFNNSYWGGVAEGAVLVDTYNFPYPVGVGFYTAKTREAPDAFGERHRSRVGRYAFLLDGPGAMVPVRLPAPGPNSYVWDPIRDGAGGRYGDTNETAIFGTANRILQMSVFINPYDGLYHLLLWQSVPSTRQGEVNRSVSLAHYWSANQGLNWVPDTGNPLPINLEALGWPPTGDANRMNSPHGFIDPWRKKGYIFWWGNPEGRQNKPGTRLWCVEFDVAA